MHQKYLLILFYSATGAVRNLAHAMADGAEKKGLEVKIRTVPKVSTVTEAVEPSMPVKERFIAPKRIYSLLWIGTWFANQIWLYGSAAEIFLRFNWRYLVKP